jgi:hypothetical protein
MDLLNKKFQAPQPGKMATHDDSAHVNGHMTVAYQGGSSFLLLWHIEGIRK